MSKLHTVEESGLFLVCDGSDGGYYYYENNDQTQDVILFYSNEKAVKARFNCSCNELIFDQVKNLYDRSLEKDFYFEGRWSTSNPNGLLQIKVDLYKHDEYRRIKDYESYRGVVLNEELYLAVKLPDNEQAIEKLFKYQSIS